MSFSNLVRNELCGVKLQCRDCKLAMAYGMVTASNSPVSISYVTESKAVSELFTSLLVDLVGAMVTIRTPDLRNRTIRPTYHVLLEDMTDQHRLFALFEQAGGYDMLIEPCCQLAFLRGVYLTCGSMIDPMKEYHIELRFRDEELCYTVMDLFEEHGVELKETNRGKHTVLYAKDSRQLEDLLTALGAVKSSMELMNFKIEKELRNTVNRRTNCETANIGKTVNASMAQVQAIERIKAENAFDALPLPLKEAAAMRLENPDASLSELCELSGDTLSRSGLNHRLNKLIKIAEALL